MITVQPIINCFYDYNQYFYYIQYILVYLVILHILLLLHTHSLNLLLNYLLVSRKQFSVQAGMFGNLIDHLVFHLYYQMQVPKQLCRRLVPLFIFGGSLDLCPMTTESHLHFREMLSGGQAESMHFSSLFYPWFQPSSPHLPVKQGISARRANGWSY